jgi:hypothetical protein
VGVLSGLTVNRPEDGISGIPMSVDECIGDLPIVDLSEVGVTSGLPSNHSERPFSKKAGFKPVRFHEQIELSSR